MVPRAIRAVGIGLVYLAAGAPALIGVAFVARYGFVTSDTATDGAATAFLFGMVAAGAFTAPAIAIAVKNRGRKAAAFAWWVLAVLAIAANWTHTLSAIAHRGAGQEASNAKISSNTAADRGTLARLERELRKLPAFTPTNTEAVTAAREAADRAQRSRIAECGPNNETRGNRCREREGEERAKLDALTKAIENKASTDRAASLEAEAAAVRQRLADAPPAPAGNALGRALGRFLPVSAAAAATFQQAFVSAIVELLIAAVLALPELLRSSRRPLHAGSPIRHAHFRTMQPRQWPQMPRYCRLSPWAPQRLPCPDLSRHVQTAPFGPLRRLRDARLSYGSTARDRPQASRDLPRPAHAGRQREPRRLGRYLRWLPCLAGREWR